MREVTPPGEPRNPVQDALTKIVADAIALAVQRPDVIAYVRAVLAPDDPETVRKDILDALAMNSKGETACLLRVSTSTIDRFCREGMPHTFAGDRKRFHIDECRAWLAARGKRAATPKQQTADGIVEAGRLRLAGDA